MAQSGTRVLTAAALVLAIIVAVVAWQLVAPKDTTGASTALTVGMISNNPNGLRNVAGFHEGLREQGLGEDDGTTFLFSGNPTPRADLEQAIAEMVSAGADLIFTAGTPTGVAAHAATQDSGVPVVFGVIADPVAAGVLSDLTRPGGNMTGVMLSQNQARRLQLLHGIVPGSERILLPYNPDDPAPVSAAMQLDETAAELGLTLVHAHARSNEEVDLLLADLPADIDAIFMLPDSTVNRRVADLLRLATARGLPVSGPSTAQVEAGATMAYGIEHHAVGLQAARIAARILRGADPAEIPVETADYFLMVNVAAADRIGLDLPEAVLQQADTILREDRFAE